MSAKEKGADMKPITKALKLARKIPNGKKTNEKRKAVHAWVLAIKEMLKA
jgi:hypothetical protein